MRKHLILKVYWKLSACLLAAVFLAACSEDMDMDGNRGHGQGNYPDLVQRAKNAVDGRPGGLIMFETESDNTNKQNTVKTRSDREPDCEVEWDKYSMEDEGGEMVAVVPIRQKARIAKVLLTSNGRNKRSTNKVVSKLIIRKDKNNEEPLVIVGTYICERSYFDDHEEEFSNVCYDFDGTHFTGYFIASRMDGSIISGTRILKGEEVFRFAWNPLSKDDKKSDCGSNEDYHFFLNILDFNDKRKTRSRKASGSIVPEEGEKIYCSFCHKLDTECTCFVIYAKCDTCGEKLNDCACSKNETCDICHQTKKDGKCGCCLVCHDYPCICGRDPNDKPETEQGGNSKPSGGGGTTTNGGGSSHEGVRGANASTTIVSAARITEAAPLAVRRATKRVGNTTSAACNFGVQEMFKELYGFLPQGMNARANEMVKYWRAHPEHWQPIQLSEAQDLANQGYFVVAGYVAPAGSGHVVVVVPGGGTISKSWGGLVPNTMDTGAGMRRNKTTLNFSFGKDKKGKIEFYYYK